MPATIAASASNAAAIVAQRRRDPAFLRRLKSLRQLRITELIVIEVHDRDAHPVLHFARTKIVQERLPPLVFFQIFSDVFG